jgi:lauroyl/myristoyl acyltransferase
LTSPSGKTYPLIPVFVPRLGTRHYAVRVCGRFALTREARDPQALDRVMVDVVQAFEDIVREYPTQWFQFTPFWPAEEREDTRSTDAIPDATEPLRARR